MIPYHDRTHDISSKDYHVNDIETFERTLEKVAVAAFPEDGHSRYRDVYVLLLSWEADDLGTAFFSSSSSSSLLFFFVITLVEELWVKY